MGLTNMNQNQRQSIAEMSTVSPVTNLVFTGLSFSVQQYIDFLAIVNIKIENMFAC